MNEPDSSVVAEASANATTPWQRHARLVWFAVRVVLILALAAAAAWWFLLAPVAVRMHAVSTGEVTAEVMGTGTLEARTSAIVGPKISGLITRIAVDQGDLVKAGELLIQLESSDLEQQVGMAESEVAAASAALERVRADRRRAEAVLVQARLNHERTKELASTKVASEQDLDRALEAQSIAEAGLSLADAAIVESEKRLVVTERSLEFQRARLHDTTIEAPFDALVVRRDRDPGDVVAPGSSVLQLVSTTEMWITAWVDETELSRLQVGQSARVVFRSEPSTDYAGRVVRIGREVDRETREMVVDVGVEKLPPNWAVGQRAEVYIRTEHREGVVTLPGNLVGFREGECGVMVNDHGRARWRPITIGVRGRETVEVASGLALGDVVVSRTDPGGGVLREGRRITSE
jgi:HlyD family secretion protein